MSNDTTILYVEDNFDNRTLVNRILMVEGYHLIEAVNATEALKVLESTRPDLILMDINMPDMDGYTLTGKIKKIPGLETIPVVALTANVMHDVLEQALAAGCNGYIGKPIAIDTLLDDIMSYLGD